MHLNYFVTEYNIFGTCFMFQDKLTVGTSYLYLRVCEKLQHGFYS